MIRGVNINVTTEYSMATALAAWGMAFSNDPLSLEKAMAKSLRGIPKTSLVAIPAVMDTATAAQIFHCTVETLRDWIASG